VNDVSRGAGRALLAAVFLMVGGVLNMIYGIAAISNSHFFAANQHYVFGHLKTWGWITLILGVIELLAAASLFGGGSFGRIFAIIVGSLAAIAALLDIPAQPFWSISVFALSLWIIHGLVMYQGGAGDYSGPPAEAMSMAPTAGGPRPPT
jgi:hypothetical protein